MLASVLKLYHAMSVWNILLVRPQFIRQVLTLMCIPFTLHHTMLALNRYTDGLFFSAGASGTVLGTKTKQNVLRNMFVTFWFWTGFPSFCHQYWRTIEILYNVSTKSLMHRQSALSNVVLTCLTLPFTIEMLALINIYNGYIYCPTLNHATLALKTYSYYWLMLHCTNIGSNALADLLVQTTFEEHSIHYVYGHTPHKKKYLKKHKIQKDS